MSEVYVAFVKQEEISHRYNPQNAHGCFAVGGLLDVEARRLDVMLVVHDQVKLGTVSLDTIVGGPEKEKARFDQFAITHYGSTIALGDYEICVDAFAYEAEIPEMVREIDLNYLRHLRTTRDASNQTLTPKEEEHLRTLEAKY
ncbi:MAG: hypothetical protein CMH61_01590 [Nanoarchaeota archaeon]|nr:hypothetical protein [Nanoarchaeota archaeon]|tara:strand:+ start:4927 stop:5355 length:429 start_codon:yes stop_codon:yes gene_type:complete